jgi:hypothetical protein
MSREAFRKLNTQLACNMVDIVGNAHMLAFGVLSDVERELALRELHRGWAAVTNALLDAEYKEAVRLEMADHQGERVA